MLMLKKVATFVGAGVAAVLLAIVPATPAQATCQIICTEIGNPASCLPPPPNCGGNPDPTDVPEPGMIGLFGLGLGAAGFAAYRRRKRK